MSTPPNWYPDPDNSNQMRWWNGTSWGSETTPYPQRKPMSKGKIAAIIIAATSPVWLIILLVAWFFIGRAIETPSAEELESIEEVTLSSPNVLTSSATYGADSSCEKLCNTLWNTITVDESFTSSDLEVLLQNLAATHPRAMEICFKNDSFDDDRIELLFEEIGMNEYSFLRCVAVSSNDFKLFK